MSPNQSRVIATVIPTYRRPDLLRRAILSVLFQTHKNVLVFVCDNASGDETKEVVAEIADLDSRVTYHCHPENIGSYNNFNYGMSRVKTPFFSLLSDDDAITPDFYAHALSALDKFPEAMFACLGAITVDINNRVLMGSSMVSETKFFYPREGFSRMVEGKLPGTWTAIVFRTVVRDAIGLIPTDVGPAADGGYVCHAAARFPFVVVPSVGGILMAHSESTSGHPWVINGLWESWQKKMMGKIAEDREVSAPVKAALSRVRILPQQYLKIGVSNTLKALAENKIEYARANALGLKSAGHPASSFFLNLFVAICSKFSFIRVCLGLAKKLALKAKQGKLIFLNTRYRREVDFMDELNALTEKLKKEHRIGGRPTIV